MLNQILRQRADAATSDATEATASFNDAQAKVQQDRVEFFYKLALFDSGSIAASVTLATALHQHPPVKEWWLLSGCWGVLLFAMVCCFARNWNSQSQHFYAAQARYYRKLAAQKAMTAETIVKTRATVLDEDGRVSDSKELIEELKLKEKQFTDDSLKIEKQSDSAFTSFRYFERAATWFTLLGLLGIIVFASINLH